MNKKFLPLFLILAVLAACQKNDVDKNENINEHIEPIAYVHNYVLNGLLSTKTKASGMNDLRSDDHAKHAAVLACEAAKLLGLSVQDDDIYASVKKNKDVFFEKFDEYGTLTAVDYIEQLPYSTSVILQMKQSFIKDLQDNGNSFETLLATLSSLETKATANEQYSYSDLYKFYCSDSELWNSYFMTKGDGVRHAVAVCTDIIVGAALSELGPIISGAVGAIASEVMENGEPNPDSPND